MAIKLKNKKLGKQSEPIFLCKGKYEYININSITRIKEYLETCELIMTNNDKLRIAKTGFNKYLKPYINSKTIFID